MTAVAAFATVATSAPAALAAEGDLAPETSEPTSAPEPADEEAAPDSTPPKSTEPADDPDESTPPPSDETPDETADTPPEAAPSEQETDGTEADPAPTAAAEGEAADEYGSQQIAVTMALAPDDFYPDDVGSQYVYVSIFKGDEYLRSANCNAPLERVETGTAVACLNESDESPTIDLGPGERATIEYYDGTQYRYVYVDPCLASECSGDPVAVDLVREGPAPSAQNRSFSARPGEPVTFDVLAFDSVDDPDTTVSIASEPSHGTVRITDDGLQRLVYTAAEDYAGTDTFTYTLTNSNGSSTGTVDVTVAEDAVTPSFGTQKYRIGTQVASGAFVPAGTTTAGSTITITTYPAGGGAPAVETCTTTPEPTGPLFPPIGLELAAAAETPTGQSSCPGDIDDGGTGIGQFLRFYTAPPGARVEITHTAVAEGQELVPDPRTVVIEPCDRNLTPTCNGFESFEPVIFDATGSILPVTRPDTATAEQGGPAIEVDVLANDDSEDPDTGLEVTPLPRNRGTIEVVGAAETPTPEPTEDVGTLAVPSAGTLRLRYTPPTGFSGTVPVQYTVTNSNGSTTGTLTITVEADEPTDPGTDDPDDSDAGEGTGSGGTEGTDGDTAPASSTRETAGAAPRATATLPRTGGPDAALAPLGALLVAAGAAALTRARRRPSAARGR